jgi:hypothetical protein
MKIVISNTDHSVDVEVADDAAGFDVNEVMAMARDLFRETRQTPAPRMGFDSMRGRLDG